jgi:hypothetical protein
MAEDTGRTKRLVAFQEKLEKRVERLDSDLKEAQAMLETVNSMLLEKGFKRAEMPKQPTRAAAKPLSEETPATPAPEPTMSQPPPEVESVVELKTVSGEVLANVYVDGDSMRVVAAEGKDFDVNMPPFGQFLIERVLMKMQERDNELARAGQLEPDRIFSYNIVRDGDVVREISIKNVDADRLRELKSSIRWTLEKMHEKMKGST